MVINLNLWPKKYIHFRSLIYTLGGLCTLYVRIQCAANLFDDHGSDGLEAHVVREMVLLVVVLPIASQAVPTQIFE